MKNCLHRSQVRGDYACTDLSGADLMRNGRRKTTASKAFKADGQAGHFTCLFWTAFRSHDAGHAGYG